MKGSEGDMKSSLYLQRIPLQEENWTLLLQICQLSVVWELPFAHSWWEEGQRMMHGANKDWRAMPGWVHKWLDHQPNSSETLEEITRSSGSLKLKWSVSWVSPFSQERCLGFPCLFIPCMLVKEENLKLSLSVEAGWIAVKEWIKCHSKLHPEQLLFAPGWSRNSCSCPS